MDPTKSKSWTIIEAVRAMNIKNGMRPVHPGEILRGELDTLGLSVSALSKALDQRGVTANTALRLARYFGTTPRVRLNLQKTRELRREEIESGGRIAERVQPLQTLVPIEESRTDPRS